MVCKDYVEEDILGIQREAVGITSEMSAPTSKQRTHGNEEALWPSPNGNVSLAKSTSLCLRRGVQRSLVHTRITTWLENRIDEK